MLTITDNIIAFLKESCLPFGSFSNFQTQINCSESFGLTPDGCPKEFVIQGACYDLLCSYRNKEQTFSTENTRTNNRACRNF